MYKDQPKRVQRLREQQETGVETVAVVVDVWLWREEGDGRADGG